MGWIKDPSRETPGGAEILPLISPRLRMCGWIGCTYPARFGEEYCATHLEEEEMERANRDPKEPDDPDWKHDEGED